MNSDTPAPLVSVVMATYNMGRYLPEALDSALSQDYAAIEVRAVDDGSSDDTPQVLERWRGGAGDIARTGRTAQPAAQPNFA